VISSTAIEGIDVLRGGSYGKDYLSKKTET
jgi:hypothetical protein